MITPPTVVKVDDDSQATEGRQSNWHEWSEDCEPGTGAWDTWGSDAIEFLDRVNWSDAANGLNQ